MTTHLWWYTARGAGIVAWVLATGAVVLGLLLSGRFGRRPKPAWLLDLHRFMGGLVVVFLGVHLAALVADSTVQFGLSDLAVPMASAWRPGAVAWGVVAAWLLIAVELTSLAQRRLPRRLWHAVHLSSFVVFGASTVHALTAGTDSTNPWFRGFALVSSAVVLNLTVLRVVSRRVGRAQPRGRAGAPTRSVAAHP
jgi:sulfoxide reductase heme-binding subunit YedZ